MPGTIVINPSVFTDKRDAYAVAVNEALRLWMEDNSFAPETTPTEEQRAFFKGTAYARDEDAMIKTILARIATRDTSVKGTPEQVAEVSRILDGVMDTEGLSMKDFMLASRMQEALSYDNPPATDAEEAADAPDGKGSTTSAMGGGDVREYAREDKYSTRLNPEEMQQFIKWKAENAPNDSGIDYDLQGAFMDGQGSGGKEHMTDKFKKPNHPTFSKESKYSTPKTPGGEWGTDESGKPTFTPSAQMLEDTERIDNLRKYMKKAEPDVKLILPQNGMSSTESGSSESSGSASSSQGTTSSNSSSSPSAGM